MYPIRDSSRLANAVVAWSHVFTTMQPGSGYPSTLAFRQPFVERVATASVLYPLDGYYLTPDQFAALGAAAVKFGNGKCYVSTYEDTPDFLSQLDVRGDARHYELDFADDGYDEYCKTIPWPLEHALYSCTGSWGLIVSHEMHAILGGSRAWIDEFRARYRRWKRDVAELKYFWRGNPNGHWVDQLCKRIPEADAIEAAPPTEGEGVI